MKQQYQTRTNPVSRVQNHLEYRAFRGTEGRSYRDGWGVPNRRGGPFPLHIVYRSLSGATTMLLVRVPLRWVLIPRLGRFCEPTVFILRDREPAGRAAGGATSP